MNMELFQCLNTNSLNQIIILKLDWQEIGLNNQLSYSLQNSFIYSKQLVDCIIKDKTRYKRKKVILYFRQKFFVIF